MLMLVTLSSWATEPVDAQLADFDEPESNEADPVTGGALAADGVWPDAAGIAFRGGDVSCTGVLVAPDVVLTAGHCAGGIEQVVLDSTDWKHPNELIDVIRTHEYPNSWKTYDISVLILAEPSSVEPRIIASDCVRDEELFDGAEVAVVGYGNIDYSGNQGTHELHEGTTFIQDHDCDEKKLDGVSTGCNDSVSPGGELGAGGNGVDACFGDSGGPLYLITERGDFVVGLTSRAYDGVSWNTPCRDGGVYVRPDAVMDWIEDVSGRTLPRPSCNAAPTAFADDIQTVAGVPGFTWVQVDDPDGMAFDVAVATSPSHGRIELALDGEVTYIPDAGFAGADAFKLMVTDDGSDYAASGPLSVPVDVAVLVLGGSAEGGGQSNVATAGEPIKAGGCGCNGAPGVGWMALAAPLLLWRRRR